MPRSTRARLPRGAVAARSPVGPLLTFDHYRTRERGWGEGKAAIALPDEAGIRHGEDLFFFDAETCLSGGIHMENTSYSSMF